MNGEWINKFNWPWSTFCCSVFTYASVMWNKIENARVTWAELHSCAHTNTHSHTWFVAIEKQQQRQQQQWQRSKSGWGISHDNVIRKKNLKFFTNQKNEYSPERERRIERDKHSNWVHDIQFIGYQSKNV